MTDLTVLYRACSIANSKEKPIQGTKYDLMKLCFDSFIQAFETVNPKVIFLIDNPDYESVELFDTCPFPHEIQTQNIGNVGTFHKQLELAVKLEGKVFLLEDDYYFLPDAGEKIIKGLNKLDGFLTPYDHPDFYRMEEHTLWEKQAVQATGTHHWATGRSTTLTFAGDVYLFRGYADLMHGYGIADYPMWNEITKTTKLWRSIPSLATHMESNMLAPTIEWESLWSK